MKGSATSILSLSDPVVKLSGVGSAVADRLARLSIKTIEDLLWHLPRRYEDFSEVTAVAELKPGQVTIAAQFSSVSARYVRRGLHITEAIATDESGSVKVVWFNQPYRERALHKDTAYLLSGEFSFSNRRYALMNPACELASSIPKNTARIIPKYPETKGLASNRLRQMIGKIVLEPESKVVIEESLPELVLKRNKLISLSRALQQIHFPESDYELLAAQRRLGFEELFNVLLASEVARHESLKLQAHPLSFQLQNTKGFIESLPFELTGAQRKAAWDILQDVALAQPMNRLLEGDVGSGKTIVAALAIEQTMAASAQTLFIAPTEILARQHYETLQKIPLFREQTIRLLVGSTSAKEKLAIKKELMTNKCLLVVGTHALLEPDVTFSKLAFVIVDEQHRFGVKQRHTLQQKAAGVMPHLLSMTATPIPRSLALTVYGELNISILDEMPAGRKPTITKLVSPNSRSEIYQKIETEVAAQKQAFVVFPLIEASDTIATVSIEQAYDSLRNKYLRSCRLDIVHGKLSNQDKQARMAAFVRGEIDVLIATTVIEVGVNVPNATVMVIEGADRFGLAQLHQLRGRVGRSSHQSWCYIIPSSSQQPSHRLKEFTHLTDGFALAELDLELRGPGEIYGAMQHGGLDLRVARLSDQKLIAEARAAAKMVVQEDPKLLQYPRLKQVVGNLRTITQLN